MRRVVCPVLWSAINRGQKPIPEDVKHLSEWCCSVFLGTCPSWPKEFMFNLEDQRNVGPLYLPAPSDVDCMYNHSSVGTGLFWLVTPFGTGGRMFFQYSHPIQLKESFSWNKLSSTWRRLSVPCTADGWCFVCEHCSVSWMSPSPPLALQRWWQWLKSTAEAWGNPDPQETGRHGFNEAAVLNLCMLTNSVSLFFLPGRRYSAQLLCAVLMSNPIIGEIPDV